MPRRRLLAVLILTLALPGCGGDAPTAAGAVDARASTVDGSGDGSGDGRSDALSRDTRPDSGGGSSGGASDTGIAVGTDAGTATDADATAASETGAVVDAAPDTTPAPDDRPLAGSAFAPFAPWSRPIDDYLAVGEQRYGPAGFLRGIHDLVVFADRLFLAYGDANVNMGRHVPIEVRAYVDPALPTPEAEFATDEEHVERYRVLGRRLWIAGVDATEDAWLGNLYERTEAGVWTKHRTVRGGVHVHDVAGFDGAAWAVGSGATPEEWNAGDIYAHLWRTWDAGETIAVVARSHNGGVGDARWVRLLPVTAGATHGLLVFGYGSDATGSIDTLPHGTVASGGDVVTPLAADHPLRLVFITETDPLPDGSGLVRGVDASREPLRTVVHHATDASDAAPVEHFRDRTVVDVFVHAPTGEVLVLSQEGDDYLAGNNLTHWSLRLEVTHDLASWTELMTFETDVRPRAVAAWRGDLYLGTDDGEVWRAARN